MIIKRKLFSTITKNQIEQWKKPLTLGQRTALSAFSGGMGVLLGFIVGSLTGSPKIAGYGALIGGALGTGYGIYGTSRKVRDKWAKKGEDKLAKIDSISKSEKERIYQDLKKVWEDQRPMSYEEFYKKYPAVKRDLEKIEFNWDLSYNDVNYPNYNSISESWSKFNPKIHIPLGYYYDDTWNIEHILFYDINSRKYILVDIMDRLDYDEYLSSQDLKKKAKYYFSTFKSYNEKYLGLNIEIDPENGELPGFDIKELKFSESDFIKAIYDYEKVFEDNSVIQPLTLQNVSKRVYLAKVSWTEGRFLEVLYSDRESDFYWEFYIESYTDKLEVANSGD